MKQLNRIQKALTALGALVKNPWLLNEILAADDRWHGYLKENYQMESGFPMVDFLALCPQFSETIEDIAFLGSSSMPTDIALLKNLCHRFEKCQYFEIGTWRGETVSNVATVADTCYTLNLSKEEIQARGFDSSYTDLHDFFSKHKRNIKHLKGNSLTYDFAGLEKKFDLIFIDGDHHYEAVKKDTQSAFAHLVHEQSIIVWHDYAYAPEKLRPAVAAGILDGTPAKWHKYLYYVSNTQCAFFDRRPYPTTPFKWPQRPNKAFKIHMEAKRL